MKKLIFLALLGLATTAISETRIYGYIQDTVDTADGMANVWAVLVAPVANDTCDSTITPPREKKKLTNSSGYFFFEATPSVCLSGALYEIYFEWSGGKSRPYKITIPDQDSVDVFTLIN